MPSRHGSRWGRGPSSSTPSKSTSTPPRAGRWRSSASSGSSRRDMTGGPRRRRHDPLPARGAGRGEPPPPSTIDLHTHSTRSDGVMAPTALVLAAFEAGVRVLALTDHDTLAGYREVVAAKSAPAGMTLIAGVEINAIVTRDL